MVPWLRFMASFETLLESARDAIGMLGAQHGKGADDHGSSVPCKIGMDIFVTWHSSEHCYHLDVKWGEATVNIDFVADEGPAAF